MKKTILIFIAMLFLVFVVSCSKKIVSNTASMPEVTSESVTSTTEMDATSTPDLTGTNNPISTGGIESSASAIDESTAGTSTYGNSTPVNETTGKTSQTTISATENLRTPIDNIAPTATPKGQTPTVTPKPAVTSAPVKTPTPTPTKATVPTPTKTAVATPTPTSVPTPTPLPQELVAYKKPYNIGSIDQEGTILYNAKKYGESIGMTWSDELTVDNCSWEAPGHTTAFDPATLKHVIEVRIDRVKSIQERNGCQPGRFLFRVYFEPIANGEYTIYWLIG